MREKKLDGEDNTNRKSKIHAHKQQMKKKKTKIGRNVRVIGERAQKLNHRFTDTTHCVFQPKKL